MRFRFGVLSWAPLWAENRAFSANVMNIETILRLPFCILNSFCSVLPPPRLLAPFLQCGLALCGVLANFSQEMVHSSME